jgi:hypothetical protein
LAGPYWNRQETAPDVGDTTINTPNGKITVTSKGDIKINASKGNVWLTKTSRLAGTLF